MILSHGNASVEGGFSINKEVLVENLKEKSVVALRTVYDAIRRCGCPIQEIEIPTAMIHRVRSSRGAYLDHLKKVASEENEKGRTQVERKRKLMELEAAKSEQMSLEEKSRKITEQIRTIQKEIAF